MSNDRSRSQTYRYIAEGFLAQLPDEILTSPRADLATSLVRQWSTYEDYAILIFRGKLHRLHFVPQDDGEGSIDAVAIPLHVCFEHCIRDWHLDSTIILNAASQINLRQNAVLRNHHGQILRLWVNPKEDEHGIELQNDTEGETFYPIELIEGDAIDSLLGPNLDPRIREELVQSVDRQWTKFRGHAILVTDRMIFPIRYQSGPEFQSKLVTDRTPTTIGKDLLAKGIPPEKLGVLLHTLNLRQNVQYSDGTGRRVEVEADPLAGLVRIREHPSDPPGRNLRFGDLR